MKLTQRSWAHSSHQNNRRNGAVVQAVNHTFKKAELSNQCPKLLLFYSYITSRDNGLSPSEMLFRRRPCSSFPEIPATSTILFLFFGFEFLRGYLCFVKFSKTPLLIFFNCKFILFPDIFHLKPPYMTFSFFIFLVFMHF